LSGRGLRLREDRVRAQCRRVLRALAVQCTQRARSQVDRADLEVRRDVPGLLREERVLRSARGLALAHVRAELLVQLPAQANRLPACVRRHVRDSGAADSVTRRRRKVR
jgi:hypothetical protein